MLKISSIRFLRIFQKRVFFFSSGKENPKIASNLKNKNFNLSDLFNENEDDDKNLNEQKNLKKFDEKNVLQDDQDQEFEEEIKPTASIIEQINKNFNLSEKKPDENFNRNQNDKYAKNRNTNGQNINENLIDELLNQKNSPNSINQDKMKFSNQNYQGYNNLNRNFSNNYNNSNQSNTVQNTITNNQNPSLFKTPQQKRNKITFVREGMLLSFYLKKSTSTNFNGKNDGYLFIELREFSENYEERNAKDSRFIILNAIQTAKFLLLDPKVVRENDLQKINFSLKNRYLEIEQGTDKKYTWTLKVTKDQNSENTGSNEDKAPHIISQIEVNPEDIVIIQKFANLCIDELLFL